MRRVWSFLSDPSLHLLAIALVLIGLAIGSAGSQEVREDTVLVSCTKCRTHHYTDSAGSFTDHTSLARARR